MQVTAKISCQPARGRRLQAGRDWYNELTHIDRLGLGSAANGSSGGVRHD